MGTSAGTVTIDFAAETAKFTAELKKVRKELGSLRGDVDNINKFFAGVGKTLRSFVGIGTAAVAIGAVTRATAESEQAVAQLDSALKNAGLTVASNSKRFQTFASEMQRVSTFTDEAVIGVESILLSFQGLSGDTVLQATRAVLDLSTRLKVDLNSAAKLVGKALADPEKGLTALGRAGVVFSVAQREIIKNLVETGDVAGAQQKILAGLEARFSGAAEAARNNFGGALIAVKNAAGDLLEAKSGLPGATSALNQFADTLNDPRTKEAVGALIAVLADLATVAISVAGALASVFTVFAPTNEVDRITGAMIELEVRLKGLNTNAEGALRERERIQRQLIALDRELKAILGGGGPATRGRAPALVVAETVIDEEEERKRQDRIMQLLTSISEQKRAIQLKEFEEHAKFLEDTEKAERESVERRLALSTSIHEQRRDLALTEFATHGKFLETQYKQEVEVQAAVLELKQGALSAGLGLLQALASRSKTAALAFIALEKAQAIASVVISTAAASAKALAVYGPTPAGFAAAASAKAYGALQIALIAATGLVQAGNVISAGGAAPGTPANPIVTQPSGGLPSIGQPTAQQVTQVYITGVVTQAIVEQLIDGLEDAFDRDVVIINSASAQAQALQARNV